MDWPGKTAGNGRYARHKIMVMGEVKIFNENGREVEIVAGDMVRSKVEIVMAKP